MVRAERGVHRYQGIKVTDQVSGTLATPNFTSAWHLGQLGTYDCTVIVGFNAQLLKYLAVLHPLPVWHDRQNILAQLVSQLSREILGIWLTETRFNSASDVIDQTGFLVYT